MEFNVGWPEGIWLFLVLLRLLISAANNGKPKEEKNWNFALDFMCSMIGAALLYWGGFFN